MGNIGSHPTLPRVREDLKRYRCPLRVRQPQQSATPALVYMGSEYRKPRRASATRQTSGNGTLDGAIFGTPVVATSKHRSAEL
jgi:hypothetical protein